MQVLREMLQGAAIFTKGVALVKEPSIRSFLWLPLLINIFLFVVMIIGIFVFWDSLVSWGATTSHFPDWLRAWEGVFSWIIILFKAILWMAFVFFMMSFVGVAFTGICNFIAAPFNGFLAEKIEEKLTGERCKSLLFHQLIVRTLLRELQKILYWLPKLVLVTLVSFILGFIPGLNILGVLLTLSFSAWIIALQYIDYVMDNNQVSFSQTLKLMRARRFFCLGFGFVALPLSLVPIVSLIAMPLSVCAGTYLGLILMTRPFVFLKFSEVDNKRLVG